LATHNRTVTGSSPVGATTFGCNTASGTCVVSGLVTLKGGNLAPSSGNEPGSRNVQATVCCFSGKGIHHPGDSV
ncbi:hypothetical protein ACK6GV_005107, partial [Escherichia coli]